MNKQTIKKELQKIQEFIDENKRGGHSYNDYYGNDQVVYANIKNYNFADIDEVKSKFNKKYHKLFDRDITDEVLNDYEWDCRNWRVDGITDDGYYAEQYPNVEFVGCYGRSGGWYGITVSTDWHKNIDVMLEDLERKPSDRDYTLQDMQKAIKSWREVVACFGDIEEEAKKFNANDEVFCSIEANFVEGWDDELLKNREVKKAQELAKKYGYILAREV